MTLKDLKSQYPQVKDQIYLDHAGATLPCKQLLESFTADLSSQLLGNPHSGASPSSVTTTDRIDRIRSRILRYLNVSPQTHVVIFTRNATEGLKKVGEYIDWTENKGQFWYLRESHTSVLGIREYVLGRSNDSSRIRALTSAQVSSFLKEPRALTTNQDSKHGFHLFAFPAQCNFSGDRFPLEWINGFKKMNSDLGWRVLVDAASYATSTPLDLQTYEADFTVLSFYKLFGFPTGVGALVVRKDAIECLRKPYFGGGTVDAISWDSPWKILRQNAPQMFEDGTLPFLEIMAIDHGFDYIESIGGWEYVQSHVLALSQQVREEMASIMIKKNKGEDIPLCEIYGTSGQRGPIIAFNLYRFDGTFIGSNHVARLASLHNIHLRVGCFCNPGACAAALQWTTNDIQRHHKTFHHSCGDELDLIEGRPLGAVRISFGLSNTEEDARLWIHFLKTFFQTSNTVPRSITGNPVHASLVDMIIFPIKSCGGYHVASWPLNHSGLLLDRYWMLVDDQGRAWNQKRLPQMALLKPTRVDLNKLSVVLKAPGMENLTIVLGSTDKDPVFTSACTQRTSRSAASCDRENDWFSRALGVSCRLVSRAPKKSSDNEEQHQERPSFSNESPFMLISKPSFRDTHSRLSEKYAAVDVSCFRGNLIIDSDSLLAFAEDEWVGRSIMIGKRMFQVSDNCHRCSMICVDQRTAVKSSEPFSCLARYRRNERSQINFGIHLILDSQDVQNSTNLQVGDLVRIL